MHWVDSRRCKDTGWVHFEAVFDLLHEEVVELEEKVQLREEELDKGDPKENQRDFDERGECEGNVV
jgi:hypothetical protein